MMISLPNQCACIADALDYATRRYFYHLVCIFPQAPTKMTGYWKPALNISPQPPHPSYHSKEVELFEGHGSEVRGQGQYQGSVPWVGVSPRGRSQGSGSVLGVGHRGRGQSSGSVPGVGVGPRGRSNFGFLTFLALSLFTFEISHTYVMLYTTEVDK